MKIYIGPYVNWVGPYQIAEKILFWKDKYKDDSVHNFGKWLSEDKNGKDSLLTIICQWIYSKQKRKIKIRIDDYDSWNADVTLSPIILALLKSIKESKHGSAYIDDVDVPDELKSNKPIDEYGDDIKVHEKWTWVLDEMIWAFEQYTIDWEDQYCSGVQDYKFVPVNEEAPDNEKCFTVVDGPNNTYKVDYDGIKRHHERMVRGTTLFGKYFGSLWT